jgi:SNF2 family DNA or RNA helicase
VHNVANRIDKEIVIPIRTKSFKRDGKLFATFLDVTFIPVGRDRIKLKYAFSHEMNAIIKEMGGAKFDWDKKEWTVRNDYRTQWVINYYGKGMQNPYLNYEKELIAPPIQRQGLYQVQLDMIRWAWNKRYCMWASEMGTGKTLSAIHYLELLDPTGDVYWVGPKSALTAVRREFRIWNTKIKPHFMTYQGLTKVMKTWQDGKKAPQVLICDESSKVKNIKAQMTDAALKCADGIRADWGSEGSVILMTGTPSPKSPVDWYSQIEIIQPGFIKEGSLNRFKERLAVLEKANYGSGYELDKLVTWKDDENKCATCGKEKDHFSHILDHTFVPCKNEVANLYKRLAPIVLIRRKKDCLDLPEKRYIKIPLTPDNKTKMYSSMLRKRARSAVQGLSLVRELSDGFIYEQEPSREDHCKNCNGKGKTNVWVTRDKQKKYVPCPTCEADAIDPECYHCAGTGLIERLEHQGQEYIQEYMDCDVCKGKGTVVICARVCKEVECPKDAALKEILEQNEEVGRIVIYGGFQGSIDRVTRLCLQEGWNVWRLDGRGSKGYCVEGSSWPENLDYLDAFQDQNSVLDKVAFVGNADAGGMGLTLTRACSMVFWSNTYKPEARRQAEDRIHRIGMDENRGATYYDLIHLPEDEAVLTVLKNNMRLENMTMGQFEEVLKAVELTGSEVEDA